MPKVLVTGGCGFIGSNLVRHLLNSGMEVTVVDNLSKGSLDNLSDLDVKFHEADITDPDSLDGLFSGQDIVIHLAAYGSVVESVRQPLENFQINAAGTLNVLMAAQKAAVSKVVFSSTGGALMGDAPLPVNEESVPRPISPYGASKLACEGYCSAFASAYGMSITVLRFANVIGPISWHKGGAVTVFFKAIMEGRPIEIYGDGSATRDFLYVDDLCAGIKSAALNEDEGLTTFHLASEEEISVLELANSIMAVAGAPEHEILFHEPRKGEVLFNFASSELAEKHLSFKPNHSIQEALEKSWEWFQNYSKK